MSAYAIAIIESTTMNQEIVRYLERIDATLAPYGGEYAIHGGPCTLLNQKMGSESNCLTTFDNCSETRLRP